MVLLALSRSISPRQASIHHTTIEERIHTPNIIIFGATGAGKSSIINLIAGKNLAHTSNDALGCTLRHERHIVPVNGMLYALWDTTGLDEGTEGAVPALQAENNLRELIQGLADSQGIHLIIYCIPAARLTKDLKRNYDLFYVTIFRKKVPIALVVTGLEHRQGEMETWWNENEGALQRYGMHFDAHACVTTLDVADEVIQKRRLDSQKLLCELVVRYSALPPWRTNPSLITRVLPAFRTALRKVPLTGITGNTTTTRRVIVCDMAEDIPIEFSPGINGIWEKFTARIGDGQYEFVRMHKNALQTPAIPPARRVSEEIGDGDVGLLLFYTSPVRESKILPADMDALKTFYDISDGEIRPMIVVLRGCDDEQDAQVCWADIASRYSNIQAHLVPLPNAVDGKSAAQLKLGETIKHLCIEHVEPKVSTLKRRYAAGRRILSGMVVRRPFRRRRTQAVPATQRL